MSSIGIFVASYSQNIIFLIFFLFITGLGLGTYYPAGIGLISNWFDRERRGKAIGLHETATSAGSVIGPTIGGVIVSLYNWRLGFKVLGLSGFITLPLIYSFANEKTSNNKTTGVLEFLRNIKELVPLIIIFTLTAACWMGFTTYLTVYLTHTGYSEGIAGAMFSIMPAVSLVSMPIAGHFSDKFSRKKTITILLLASSPFIYFVSLVNYPLGRATGFPALKYIESFYLISISLAIIGLTMFASYPVVITYISDKTPKGVAGSTFGVVNAISMGASAIASPFFGYIIDLYDYEVAFLSLCGFVREQHRPLPKSLI